MTQGNYKENKIYIVLGPTSSGKTSLSLKLCKDFNGEIISADSRQVVKYLDIGTGKLPIDSIVDIEKKSDSWVINGINVWGYDLVSPNNFYSGYDFALFALNKAREIMSRGKNVFLVGGTGFYIDLFTKNIELSNIEPNMELRNELEKLSLLALQTKLTSLNKKEFERIDINNHVRLIRSIEKSLGTEKNLKPLPYFTDVEFVYIGLNAENKFLYSRVDLWLDKIWENGLVSEVENLISLGFENSSKLQGLIYKSVLGYIENRSTYTDSDISDIKQLIKYDLHAYIRRQLTYFKRNKNIHWFDISTGDYVKNIYNLVNG